ncbi:hypothetical protein CJF31_00010546 [Rutstroemia sp. NJR-2017a BVV2]|nr:hypothetical protein CJF31_00010546 [Rutstroemia sp. NJR-2017a BVV2]
MVALSHLSKMGVPWSLDEDVVLFAWLNFCIGSGVSYKNTIVGKLAEVGAERTWKGIRSRLPSVVVNYRAKDETGQPLLARGHEDDEKVAVILERGTDCLQRPPHEFRQQYRLALQKYIRENQENSKELQSNKQSKSQPLPQQRVSNVPYKKGSEVVHESEESNPEEETNQRKRRRLDKGVFKDAAKKKTQQEKATPLSSNSTKHKQSPSGRTNSKSATTANLQESSFSGQNLPTSEPERVDTRPVSELHNRQESNGEAFSLQQVRQLHSKIDVIRLHHDADRIILQEKIYQLEQENKDLKAKNSIHQATSEEFQNAGRGPLEQKIHQKNQEIYELTEKLHQKTNITLSVDMPPKPLNVMKVEQFMKDIQFELKAMVQNSDSFTGIQIPGDLTGNLERLVTVAFASSYEKLDGRTYLRNLANRCDASAVISLLAVAALNEWIFLTDFPWFGPKNSEKQELYEDIVLKSGGWDQLRWLDLAAYKARMNTTRFRDEQVTEKATNLASRLSNTLSPLFTKTANEDGQSFHTWGEDEETWKDREYHYRALFAHALKLKCHSVLTDETYSFTFTLIPSRAIPDEAMPPNAWLCMFFQVYRTLPSEDDKKSALVQTRNFLDSDSPDMPRLHRKVVYLTREASHFNSQRMNGGRNNCVFNQDGTVDELHHQHDMSRDSIPARGLSGTKASQESGYIHRKHFQQLVDERQKSGVAKEARQLVVADSSLSRGEQPPRTIMIVCKTCGKTYQRMSTMAPQGNKQMVPWQATGTVINKSQTNDQELVNDTAMNVFNPTWGRDGHTTEETGALAQKLFGDGPPTHLPPLPPAIQNSGHQNQDISAEAHEIEPVNQINCKLASSIDRGSTLNEVPSFVEGRVPERLILHTSAKKQRVSHSSNPSEMLEGAEGTIEKMQLDGEVAQVDDDKVPASGSEYGDSGDL